MYVVRRSFRLGNRKYEPHEILEDVSMIPTKNLRSMLNIGMLVHIPTREEVMRDLEQKKQQTAAEKTPEPKPKPEQKTKRPPRNKQA